MIWVGTLIETKLRETNIIRHFEIWKFSIIIIIDIAM